MFGLFLPFIMHFLTEVRQKYDTIFEIIYLFFRFVIKKVRYIY